MFKRLLAATELVDFCDAPVPPCFQYSKADFNKDIIRLKKKLDEFCRVIPAEIEHDFNVWGGALPHLKISICAVR